MCDELSDIVRSLHRFMANLACDELSGREARALVDAATEAERICAATRTLAAGRVAQTMAWRHTSARTAAQWLANQTGSTVGHAIDSLETARRLADLPATCEAF